MLSNFKFNSIVVNNRTLILSNIIAFTTNSEDICILDYDLLSFNAENAGVFHSNEVDTIKQTVGLIHSKFLRNGAATIIPALLTDRFLSKSKNINAKNIPGLQDEFGYKGDLPSISEECIRLLSENTSYVIEIKSQYLMLYRANVLLDASEYDCIAPLKSLNNSVS